MKNKTILITGICGSFGTAMTSYLLANGIKKIIGFSRDEKKHYDFKKQFPDKRIELIIGDVRDYQAINNAIKGRDVDYVIHAAAMKQVPACEKFPIEAIKTNVDGSRNVMFACLKNKVKKAVFLSTDKAANAETTYGSTKYLEEKMALALGNDETEFVVTRYGNVLGSNGSVVPFFKQLAKENKPLTVVNPDMTRFFMTLDEAVKLVLLALEKGKNGELFILKNKSATIQMLADCISDNQVVIGNRCDEKNGEALLTIDELNHSILYDNYYCVVSRETTNPIKHEQPYTSDNADRFTLEELKVLIDEC